jgi:acetyl/propionyl-CoA carboxylase alpha subunit
VFSLDKHVRIDSGFEQGDQVSPNYDPMLAKIIVHGESRASALQELHDACAETRVWPVKTNAGFLVRCLSDEGFAQGDVDTSLIASRGERLTTPPEPDADVSAAAAGAALWHDHGKASASIAARLSPWTKITGFRLNAPANRAVALRYRGAPYRAEWGKEWGHARGFLAQRQHLVVVHQRGEAYEFSFDAGERAAGEASAGDGAILSPMPGKIVSVAAKAGAKVKKGEPLLVLEAMKMEHTLTAPFDGKVADLKAKAGEQVSEGVLLAKLEAE